jgi:Fe-S-cluster containining protein
MKNTIVDDMGYEAERKSIFKTLKQKLRFKSVSAPELIKAVQIFDQRMDEVIHQRVKKLKNIACRSGCAHCCHQMVGASPLEVFLMAEAINNQYADQKNTLLERLALHATQAENNWDQPPRYDQACPFLIESRCSIYAVRPSGCRKAHSLDVARCEAFFLQNSEEQISGDKELDQRCLGVRKGFQQAISSLDLDVEPVDMQHSVYMALIHPELLQRWLLGERVFPMQINLNGRFFDMSLLEKKAEE